MHQSKKHNRKLRGQRAIREMVADIEVKVDSNSKLPNNLCIDQKLKRLRRSKRASLLNRRKQRIDSKITEDKIKGNNQYTESKEVLQ
jgi:hypothetical protein